ncbi:MAG: CHRD domain-containing protein [Bacteroidia bacterium]
MKKITLFTTLLVALLISTMAPATHLRDHLLLSARMDGAQEVPAVATNAVGIASFMLNPTRDSVCVDITVTGLSGPLVGIHIHDGELGTNGGVLIDLSSFISGNRITTILTGANASPAAIAKMLSGQLYVNGHTSANPNGEIRGQIYLETDYSFPVMLSGSQNAPPLATNAYGVGVFNLSKDFSKIKFNIITQGLSGAITGAHLHFGMHGVAGPIAVSISTNVNGDEIFGDIVGPSQAVIDSLFAKSIYINVHTLANPNGEIRSQLVWEKNYLYFDAALGGNQEVPPVITGAKGAAAIKINASFDTLWYDISVTNLSGPITGAHFHNGVVLTTGAVVADLSSSINGNRITGIVTGSVLNSALLNKFFKAEIYLNVHTAQNPNGEIRGQVYRLAREGYTVALNGTQEVPSVSTNASGSGIVSVDRTQDNAHFMFVINGLSATGAHFHNSVMGQNGGVVYDLTSLIVNNGIFGYWRSSDATPFLVGNSVQFRNDSIYVNVHTVANPNGEIRGQVDRGFNCSNTSTGIAQNSSSNNILNLYPNPSSDNLFIDLNLNESFSGEINITNLLGESVYNSIQDPSANTKTIQINIIDWQTGMYFVNLIQGSKTSTLKFVKN